MIMTMMIDDNDDN